MRNNKNGRIKEPELKESVPRPRQITKSGKKKREKSEGGKNRKIRKRKRERERERERKNTVESVEFDMFLAKPVLMIDYSVQHITTALQ